jgi:hypothetical protein
LGFSVRVLGACGTLLDKFTRYVFCHGTLSPKGGG